MKTILWAEEVNKASIPQVGGKVIEVSPALINGGQFRKGDILLRIDPIDYQLAVTLAEAKVKDSQSKLELAKEEAAAAREEWRIIKGTGSKSQTKPPPLVAREPQLAAARARLKADRADLRKAKPASAKGQYMQKVTVSTTMGPGIVVDHTSYV